MTRRTITHPPLAALADCMAALDELDGDADRAWVLAALRSDPRYAVLGADVPLPATTGGNAHYGRPPTASEDALAGGDVHP